MGVVFKRIDSPYYWLAYKKGGKRVRESSGTKSKTLATEILRRKEAEALIFPQNINNGDLSLEAYVKEFLEWVKVTRRPHTFRSYSSVLRIFIGYLNGAGQDKHLRDMTLKVLEDYKHNRIIKSKTCTVKNHVIILKTFFQRAVEWGYLAQNPAKNLRAIEITDSKPIRYLSEEEYRRFMEVCKSEFSEFYPMFYTFVHTGLRKGELLSLEWSDIDLKNGYIYVRSKEDFRPKGINRNTGRAKERVVPIHEGLKRVLQSIPKDEQKVFKAYDKHRPRRVLIRIAQKAGIEGLTRLHELRHSYATFLLKKGVDIYKIKELLGHSDIRDTMKYVHLPTIHMKDEVKLLEGLDCIADNS